MNLLGGMNMRTGRSAYRMSLKCGCATPAVETILRHCAPCGIDLDQRSAGARLRGAGKYGELCRGREKTLDEGGQLRGLVVVHHVAAVIEHHFFEMFERAFAFRELRRRVVPP